MASLERCNLAQCIAVAGESIEFDYLLVTAGLASSALEQSNRVLTLDDFSKEPSAGLLRSRLENSGGIANRHITVVGAGATGIQFLFELADWIRREHLPWRLRLVDSEATPLTQFNSKLHRYVAAKIIETEVEYVPRYFFRGQGDSTVRLENRDSGELSERPSDLTLLFAGKCPESRIETNWFGQVVSEGAVFERVFAAGDRACYPVPGSNALSAQSAVRKGKLAARNILRHSGSLKLLEPYLHQDLGYVISLGADDAIGWVGLERNVIGGRPATMIKELVESQYELLLAGVDTYLI
jgi:NADH dehydrogenase